MDTNLSTWWSDVWTAWSGPADPLLKLAGFAGAAVLAYIVISFLWRKLRGGASGARQGAPGWAIVLAAVLAAPSVLMPIVFALADAGINGGVDVFNRATGG
ncbi:MAG: hypothetical protein ACRD0G_13760 [Acidimicrobiales bacterium]